MKMAQLIADEESKCIAHKVGCVIVKNDHIVSTGYNGTPKGQPNCCDVNTDLVVDGLFQEFVDEEAKEAHHEWSLKNELHAEMNAIIYAKPEDLQGSTVYCTLQPCYICSSLLAGAGVKRIIYYKKYHRCVGDNPVLSNIEVINFYDLKDKK